jgi:hypothetical protein
MAKSTALAKNSSSTQEQEVPLSHIEQLCPDCWVLVEETAWDKRGNPLRGIVRAHSVNRDDISACRQKIHKNPGVITFVFYTGDVIPKGVTFIL